MRILIIQECGRHLENRNFRESLCLKRGLDKIDGIETIVWGLNYPNYNNFTEMEKWCDVIFILENYTPEWLPYESILKSKKLKVFWSIDSHCVLSMHQNLCKNLKIDILLNSTLDYVEEFKQYTSKQYWFPNCYPSDLIFPMNVEKKYDLGFCGNELNRGHYLKFLERFKIKKDIFVIGNKMVESINSYKIHFNKNISNDINYRTFETTGCGTFLITNYDKNLELLFDIEKELVTYKNLEELEEKISFYLRNEKDRIEISNAGFKKCSTNHTYDVRSKQLIDILNRD